MEIFILKILRLQIHNQGGGGFGFFGGLSAWRADDCLLVGPPVAPWSVSPVF